MIPETPPAWVDEMALEVAREIVQRVYVGDFEDFRATARVQCAVVEILMAERKIRRQNEFR